MSALRSLFLQHVAQTSEFPLNIEVAHAKGMYIYDTNGKAYLDFDSGISVSALGHLYPDVVSAVQNQLTKYMHTMVYGEHIQAPQVEYAALLAEILNNGLDSTYFVNSGTEAVEAAIKLCRKATGRYQIIAARQAYHGSTMGAESLRSDMDFLRHYMPSVPGVYHINFNNVEDLEYINNETACVIIEPVQAEAGVLPPENNYLNKLRKQCDKTGALLILDEIQTGFGRTGFMFAHQKYGIVPDVLLLAKGMGGGMPIGALVAKRDLMAHFASNPMLGHITTFGGHPVSVAAALATLKILHSKKYICEVLEKEKYLIDNLVHTHIRSIRSSGLLMALELSDKALLMPLVHKCINNGVLIDFFLFNEASIRIAPPLIATQSDLDKGIERILQSLDEINV